MKAIYGSVKIVGLPDSGSSDSSSGTGTGGKANHDLTKELVKAMIVAKETVGAANSNGVQSSLDS